MSKIITGRLITYTFPYQDYEEKFIARVRFSAGNGRYFDLLKLWLSGKKKADQFTWSENEPTGLDAARDRPNVSIIPTDDANKSFERFLSLSDTAGAVVILTPWVNMQKSGLPSINKIAQYKNTKINPNLWKNLKIAITAYEDNRSFDTAEAVILAYNACPNKVT